MNETIFVFEYQPPQKPGDTCCTHYNSTYQGKLQHPLFSNNYYPIAVLPEDIRLHPRWGEFLDWVNKYTPSPEKVQAALYQWIFDNCPEWHIKLDNK